MVVLKRLNDAIADHDSIDAVVKGSAITNDGAHKVSYTAPQVDSQAEAIYNALTAADVSADSITYIEGHGTGTPMGDPIELAALNLAFRRHTARKQYCALGSVKSNIGHLDAAAGIAGLIKTILALKHRQIPASLHYKNANPEIDFDNSPCYVNSSLSDWNSGETPRRAGVSSFGIGGTNAHVILEEHLPTPQPRADLELCRTPVVLPLSAATESALAHQSSGLAAYLEAHSKTSLSNIAYTLQEGRRELTYRTAIIANSHSEAIEQLRVSCPRHRSLENPSIVFLCPGQGTKHQTQIDNQAFKAARNECLSRIKSNPSIPRGSLESECFALFTQQYAIAQMLRSFGIEPSALLGHSFGEIVSACLANVIDLKTALYVVSLRARLQDATTAGAMLAVALSPSQASLYLEGTLALAAHNGPEWVTLSGLPAEIDQLETELKKHSVPFKRLDSTRAFHSSLMDDSAEQLRQALGDILLRPATVPFISGVTGDWITDTEATAPQYWARQLREPVQFYRGIETALKLPNPIFIELSDGSTLSQFVSQQDPVPTHNLNSTAEALIAKLWTHGVPLDWQKGRSPEIEFGRVPLPTYPFERQRFWVHPSRPSLTPPNRDIAPVTAIGDWFYHPRWRQTLALPEPTPATERPRWLVFADEDGIGDALAQLAETKGIDTICVDASDRFEASGFRRFNANPNDPTSLVALFDELAHRETQPTRIIYLWHEKAPQPTGLLGVAQSLNDDAIVFSIITFYSQNVLGTEPLDLTQSSLPALCHVIGQEHPNLGCHVIDIETGDKSETVKTLWDELRVATPPPLVAYRASKRWERDFAPLHLSPPKQGLRSGSLFIVIGEATSTVAQSWAHALSENKVVSINADVPNLENAVSTAIEEHGKPRGIFICSPTTSDKSAAPLSLLTETYWQYNSATKINRLQALAPIIQATNPRFVCVQSSISTVLGGIGLAAYATVNQQLNEFVDHQNRSGKIRWYSINLDRVRAAATDSEPVVQLPNSNETKPLTQQELWECTLRLLKGAPPGVYAVSNQPLAPRIARWISSSPRAIRSDSNSSHLRPDLPTPFAPPTNDVESQVVKIWEEFLGIKGIGIHDNFFALGGHSLLAIQVISRLRETFPVEIELRHLISDNPTPASIAEVLTSLLPQGVELDEMTALLKDIESLSPEEAKNQLKKP